MLPCVVSRRGLVAIVQLAFSSIFLALCPPFAPHAPRFLCEANDRQFCGIPSSRMCDGVIDCDSGTDESVGMCERKFVEIKLII